MMGLTMMNARVGNLGGRELGLGGVSAFSRRRDSIPPFFCFRVFEMFIGTPTDR